MDRRLRARIAGRVPVAHLAYRRLLKPLLCEPSDGQGHALVHFPDFMVCVDPTHMPGEVLLGRPWAWEPATTFVFRHVVQPGDVVVDVGAHWGYFTILAATLCGPAGKVFAFEPHPKNFVLLRKSIVANKLTNVVAIPKAVSNRCSTTKLFQGTEQDSSLTHSIVHQPLPYAPVAGPAAPPPAPLDVETTTLDQFFRSSPVRPSLLKMDIEGAEPLALSGMDHLIASNPQMGIILEVNPHFLDGNGRTALLQGLAAYGFNFMTVDDVADGLTAACYEDALRALLRLPFSSVLNMFCTRNLELIERLVRDHAVIRKADCSTRDGSDQSDGPKGRATLSV
jgi:FkbM family methyltransferase